MEGGGMQHGGEGGAHQVAAHLDVPPSCPALQLMNIGDADKKVEYVEHWQGQPLVATTCITCMDVMKLTVDEVRG